MRQYLIKDNRLNKDGYYSVVYNLDYIDITTISDITTYLYKIDTFNFYILLNIYEKYFYIINFDDVNLNKTDYKRIINSHKNKISSYIRIGFFFPLTLTTSSFLVSNLSFISL